MGSKKPQPVPPPDDPRRVVPSAYRDARPTSPPPPPKAMDCPAPPSKFQFWEVRTGGHVERFEFPLPDSDINARPHCIPAWILVAVGVLIGLALRVSL